MGYGDEILAAGQAQRAFDRDGLKSCIVDVERRARWHPIWDGNPIILKEGNREPPQHVHTIVNGPNARPYIVYPFTEDTGWTFNKDFHAREHIAKIYLTDEEREIGRRLREVIGPYVLIEPWSKHANLRWPLAHWQELIAILPPELTIVQHLHTDNPFPLAGIESIVTTTFREACGVLASADLYVRGESGMCHAAAALDIPNVVIWGGCMDWDVLGGYPKQVGVGISAPCCGRYRPCTHCKRTMYEIGLLDVREAIVAQLDRFPQSA